MGAANIRRTIRRFYQKLHGVLFSSQMSNQGSFGYVLDRPELCVDVDKSAVYPLFDTSLSEYALPTRYIPKIPDAWTAEVMFANSVGQGGVCTWKPMVLYLIDTGLNMCSFPEHPYLCTMHLRYGVPPCLQDAAVSVQDAISINPGVAHLRGIASCGRIILDNAGRRFMNDNSSIRA